MVDTIGIWISEQSIPHLDLLSELPLLLSSYKEYEDKAGRVYVKGKLGNLTIKINEEGVSIIGSIPKFMYGNNFQVAHRKAIYQFCEKCSDLLHLNIGKGKLYRMDIGMNLHTIHKPTLYYPYLGNLNRFKRLEQPDSIRYENKWRVLVVYDKQKQTMESRQKVPQAYWGMNILRMECRLPNTKSIKKHFPFAHQLGELWEKRVFDLMENSFKYIYYQINKVRAIKIDRAKVTTDNAFARQLQAIGMDHLGGYDKTLSLAKEIKQAGYFNCDKSYQRVRTRLKSLQLDYQESYPNEFIQELDTKVNGFTI